MATSSLTNEELNAVIIAVNQQLIETKLVSGRAAHYQLLRRAYVKLMALQRDRGPVDRQYKGT